MLRRTTALTLAVLFASAAAFAQGAAKQYYAQVQSFNGGTLVVQWQTGPNKGQTTSLAVGGTPVFSGKNQVTAADLQNAVRVTLLIDASGKPTKIEITASKGRAAAGKGGPVAPGGGANGGCPAGFKKHPYYGVTTSVCLSDKIVACTPPYAEFVVFSGTHSCGQLKKGSSPCPGPKQYTDKQGKMYCVIPTCGKTSVIKAGDDPQFHCGTN